MSLKHLAKGSPKPSNVERKLRLYSMQFCPFAQRVRIILLLKNIPHDIVNVHLIKKPDWLFKLNPAGMIPILDTGSDILTESLNICDYLDKQYPNHHLYPQDQNKRKQDKELINMFEDNNYLYEKVINKQLKIEDILPKVKEFETELGKRGLFFGGAKPNMVDYMIWPWAERAGVLSLVSQEDLPSEDEFPALYAWYKAMLSRDEVEKTVTSIDRHYKIQKQYLDSLDTVDYDSI